MRNGKTYVSEDEEAEFLYACRRFALGYAPGDTPPIPKRSFERYWETRCEADWRKAFRMFTYGVPMFLTTLTLSAWLKFWYSLAARLIVTLVAVLGVVIWFQTQRTWGAHLCTWVALVCMRIARVRNWNARMYLNQTYTLPTTLLLLPSLPSSRPAFVEYLSQTCTLPTTLIHLQRLPYRLKQELH